MKKISAKKLLNSLTFRESTAKYAVKLTEDGWIFARASAINGKIYLEDLFIEKINRKVAAINLLDEIQELYESLQRVVNHYDLIGCDVMIVLPAGLCRVGIHEIPFDLNQKSERSEFLSASEEKEFWVEFDSDIQDNRSVQIGYQHLGSGAAEGTSELLLAWTKQDVITKFTDIFLSAKLNPIGFVPEILGHFNFLLPQIDKYETLGYFGVLHLSRGENKLYAIGSDRIQSATVSLLDLDEEMFAQIESVPSIQGEFWNEIGMRVAGAIRQSILYLKEQEGTPVIRNVYLISDGKSKANFIQLVNSNLPISRLCEFTFNAVNESESFASSKKTNKIVSNTALSDLLGACLQPLSTQKLKVSNSEFIKYQINLHPNRNKLSVNRGLRRLERFSLATAGILFSLSLIISVFYMVPRYIYLSHQVSLYQKEINSLDEKTQQIEILQRDSNKIKDDMARLHFGESDVTQSNFLVDLSRVIPPGVELSYMLSGADQDKFKIRGVAVNSSGPQTLLSNFVVDEILDGPTLTITSKDSNGRIVFEIVGRPGKNLKVGRASDV